MTEHIITINLESKMSSEELEMYIRNELEYHLLVISSYEDKVYHKSEAR